MTNRAVVSLRWNLHKSTKIHPNSLALPHHSRCSLSENGSIPPLSTQPLQVWTLPVVQLAGFWRTTKTLYLSELTRGVNQEQPQDPRASVTQTVWPLMMQGVMELNSRRQSWARTKGLRAPSQAHVTRLFFSPVLSAERRVKEGRCPEGEHGGPRERTKTLQNRALNLLTLGVHGKPRLWPSGLWRGSLAP